MTLKPGCPHPQVPQYPGAYPVHPPGGSSKADMIPAKHGPGASSLVINNTLPITHGYPSAYYVSQQHRNGAFQYPLAI